MIFQGKAHKVGDHIDTDAIIPARFLVTTDPKELGQHCMAGLQEGFIQKVKPGDILVGGKNFGCGSSREHAPLAILGAGIPVVVAHSFARIFYRNGFNMGLILLEVGEEVEKISEGDELKIDTQEGEIEIVNKNIKLKVNPVPEFMQQIVNAGGLINFAKNRIEKGE